MGSVTRTHTRVNMNAALIQVDLGPAEVLEIVGAEH